MLTIVPAVVLAAVTVMVCLMSAEVILSFTVPILPCSSFIEPTIFFDVVARVFGLAPIVLPIQLNNELNVFIYSPFYTSYFLNFGAATFVFGVGGVSLTDVPLTDFVAAAIDFALMVGVLDFLPLRLRR